MLANVNWDMSLLGHQVNTGFGFFDLMLRFDEEANIPAFRFPARTKQGKTLKPAQKPPSC